MPLCAGDKLGPYEIVAPLGAGGMGEVYRARDSKLQRDVAIKVLPAALANDAQYMARFEREAQILAALNHPNIAAAYGIEQGALVMELVEGDSPKGPLPLEEALAIARQIASGLEAAHERGIIHRDVKPANIKLTPAGLVKILDFGLAKVAQAAGGDAVSNPTMSPTLSMEMTRAGMILGTAAYMSPEQARGKPVDKRADIWAFGVVLYEMLTGKRLFDGEDLTETLASVVKVDPRLDRAPREVRRLLRKCLEKDPRNRLRDIGDAWELLEDAPESRSGSRFPMAGWIAAAILAAIAGVSLWAPWRGLPAAPAVKRYQIPMKGEADKPLVPFAVSPDGRSLAYTEWDRSGIRMWVQSLASLEAHIAPGSESSNSPPFYPIWSADSQNIAFTSGGKLRRVNVAGGPARIICDVSARNVTQGSWNRDGVILFADGDAILQVSETGGTAALVVAPHGAVKHGGSFPFFLPDGRHFLYNGATGQADQGDLYIGSLDKKPEAQDIKPLLAAAAAAVFAPDPDQPDFGYLLFSRDHTLLSQRFNTSRLQFVGEASLVADQVGQLGYLPFYSVSTNGVLIFHPGVRPARFQLTWFDRKGNSTGVLGDPAPFNGAQLSPDGKHIVAAVEDYSKSSPVSDLWISDLPGFRRQFTFAPGLVFAPVWSPDGSRIAFARGGHTLKIYVKAADGAGGESSLEATGERPWPTDWSTDGRYILYRVYGAGRANHGIWVLPVDGKSKPFPFLNTAADESQGIFSPDGRLVSYVSNETGSNEIYVRPFPPTDSGKWRVSTGGNQNGGWRQDGKELYYESADGSIMSAPVTTSPVFQHGEPKLLFKRPSNGWLAGSTRDLGRFLVAVPSAAGTRLEPLTVVLNWTALVKK
jgi:Tol biopolymer transport system component/tRNA A-37 threonylcarbamoyl transferase component Bud32